MMHARRLVPAVGAALIILTNAVALGDLGRGNG